LKGTTYWYETATNLALVNTANVFTQKQTVNMGAIGGDAFELISTNATAGGGPDLSLYRDSATPAAADVLSRIIWRGEDSAGNKQDYAYLEGAILDPVSTSEDGELRAYTALAGSVAPRLTLAAGLVVNGVAGTVPAGGDKGVGTINTDLGMYVDGHGMAVQHKAVFNSVYTTLGTILPHDDTIPQITEGNEVLSVTITPISALSRFILRATLNVGGATSLQVSGSTFRVGFTDGIGSSSISLNSTNFMDQLIVAASYDAVDLTARTYTVRVGSAAASDVFLNGDGTARVFGGSAVSRLDIYEVLTQE